MTVVVNRYGQASAAGAASQYRAYRVAAGIRSTLPPIVPPPRVSVGDMLNFLGGAVSNLYGPVSAQSTVAALTNVQGVAERQVLDRGRMTTLALVHKDPKVTGWARAIEPGACAFCALLSTRLYRREESADFQAHPHCRCIPEPVFGDFEPSPLASIAQDIYAEHAAPLRGSAAVAAFRQAWDSRNA